MRSRGVAVGRELRGLSWWRRQWLRSCLVALSLAWAVLDDIAPSLECTRSAQLVARTVALFALSTVARRSCVRSLSSLFSRHLLFIARPPAVLRLTSRCLLVPR